MKFEKIKTGIDSLDGLLDGGIPAKHSVLLAGSCGTGKTILSQSFLFAGAKYYNEPGLYISLSESREKMLSYLSNFDFYDQRVIDEQKIRVVDITEDLRLRNLEPLTVQSVMDVILTVIKENKAKRVVIDSITAICNSLNKEANIRDFIFELGLQLQYLDCTTILISEIPPMKFQYSVYGIEEFITDGVILMREMENTGGDLVRTLQIIKMRGVAHSRSRNLLEINRSGIEIKPMFEI
jgi:KaiC/GvpD/RAD55 family RecA-like ATPase